MYKNKYLKYKNKYLKLKESLGGSMSPEMAQCSHPPYKNKENGKINIDYFVKLFKESDKNFIHELIKCGEINEILNTIDNKGNTILHHVCLNDNFDKINIILKHNINIEETNDNDETPLIIAIQKNNIKIVNLLLENGANPNIFFNDKPIILYALEKNKNDNYYEIIVSLLLKLDSESLDIITYINNIGSEENRKTLLLLLIYLINQNKNETLDMLNINSNIFVIKILTLLIHIYCVKYKKLQVVSFSDKIGITHNDISHESNASNKKSLWSLFYNYLSINNMENKINDIIEKFSKLLHYTTPCSAQIISSNSPHQNHTSSKHTSPKITPRPNTPRQKSHHVQTHLTKNHNTSNTPRQ